MDCHRYVNPFTGGQHGGGRNFFNAESTGTRQNLEDRPDPEKNSHPQTGSIVYRSFHIIYTYIYSYIIILMIMIIMIVKMMI